MSGLRVWSFQSYRLLWSVLDLVFPPNCAGCGKPGSRWCSDCRVSIIPIPEPQCEVCGTPQRKSGICPSCSSSRPNYIKLRSWAIFDGPIRDALHHLKYRRDFGLGDSLADPLKDFVISLRWQFEMVVPIPLSKQRHKERGYNQIALVAYPLAMRLGLPYSPKALIRIKHTCSQAGLSALQRKANVNGAFAADRKIICGKSILLMDDVSTTGSTIAAASELLMNSGASNVFALTLARALAHHGLTDA